MLSVHGTGRVRVVGGVVDGATIQTGLVRSTPQVVEKLRDLKKKAKFLLPDLSELGVPGSRASRVWWPPKKFCDPPMV